MSTSKQTHNHDEIESWVEEHDGVPAIIKGTGNGKGDGVLRIHFPDHSDNDDQFSKVSWEDFFEEFDKNKLDFLYQDKKKDGEPSTFHKFVARG
ncbi:hypothetical protein [Pedobacter sp. SYP-B3415]|uniref:hypothetical protein n=1 Tax=Pedobacter sp. SYP-B3415 TaxID=2496641 RepID=UPI00101C2F42|nr:hypothetical protein [Pedobacter sp. SYP-B3415]